MKLEDEQSEPANVRRPAMQMPHQVFFQFIAGNLISQVSKCAAGLPPPRSSYIVRRPQIRPVMIQKRAHMKQVVHVMPKRLEISRQKGRTVDISGDDKMVWNLGLSQSLFGDPASHLIEIHSDDQKWMLV